MQGYTYLGVNLDRRLDWRYNTDAAYEEGQSAISSVVVCWRSYTSDNDSKKLNYTSKKGFLCAGNCSGGPGDDFWKAELCMQSIMDNSAYSLHRLLMKQCSVLGCFSSTVINDHEVQEQ